MANDCCLHLLVLIKFVDPQLFAGEDAPGLPEGQCWAILLHLEAVEAVWGEAKLVIQSVMWGELQQKIIYSPSL